MSVLQTVQKNNRQFTYGQTVQKNNKQFTYGQTVQKTALEHLQCSRQCKKNNNSNLHMDRQCKKNNNSNLHMDRQCKKNNNSNLHMDRQCKKKTTAIYIWTDSAKKTTAIYIWTVHIYRLYRRQCAKYTYMHSVRLVYYRDILNYQRHIIHVQYLYIMWSIHSSNVRCNRL